METDQKGRLKTVNNRKTVNNKWKLLLFSLGLIALIAAASFIYGMLQGRDLNNGPENPGSEQNRAAAPDFSFTDDTGALVKLSDFFGRPIVLNFWASWCPPCKNEMPEFDKAYGELKDSVVFLMVNLTDGQQETVESGRNYVAGQGFSFPVYFDTKNEASRAYRLSYIPQTCFIDRDGRLVHSSTGQINKETLRRYIDIILDNNDAPDNGR